MLDLVIGQQTTTTIRNLITELSNLNLQGILYIGYPILATYDNKTTVDALLISEEHGLVVFDLANTNPNTKDFWDNLEDKQDELYSAIYQKLYPHKTLRKRKNLAVEINVVTYLPQSVLSPAGKEDVLTAGPKELKKVLSSFSPLPTPYKKPLYEVFQQVSKIRPLKKRSYIKKTNSRGAILEQIEQSLTTLDRWQNQAVIQLLAGPQRIRGLTGSGKTIVLAFKAAYLHTQHPNWKIAITFQTRSLYQEFEHLIRQFIQGEPNWDKLHILQAWGSSTKSGMYATIATAYGFEPRDFYYGQEKYGWDNALAGVCEELLERTENFDVAPIYDAILIDEAQDLPLAFLRLAYKVLNEPKRIVWAYDPFQNVENANLMSPKKLFGVDKHNHQPNESQQDIILPICYRNTPWALTTAHALGLGIYRPQSLIQYFNEPELWHKMGYELLAGDNVAGHRVTFSRNSEATPPYFNKLLSATDAIVCKIFNDPQEQADWVATEIKKNITEDELKPSDILIILSEAYTSSSEANIIRKALFQQELHVHLAGVGSSEDTLYISNSIAMSHIYRVKGNEAPMVYIINSQHGFEGPELIKHRNNLFTAITRSKAWVRICGWGEAMKALKAEIDQIIDNKFQLTFQVPATLQLNKIEQVYSNSTQHRQHKFEKIEEAIEQYVTGIENGDIKEDIISRPLREKLRNLLVEA